MILKAAQRLIEVHYINLSRATDRRRFMEAQARLRGIELVRFHAIDAGALPDQALKRLTGRWERPITRPELAAFLSHEALWRMAASTSQGLVVLEDDSVISAAFGASLAALPDGFDLINFETVGRRKFFSKKSVPFGSDRQVTQLLRDKSGAGAYFVSPQGARVLLTLCESHTAPVDAFMFAVARLRIGQVEPAMTMQVHILAEHGFDVGFATQTSIHEPRQRLPLCIRNLSYHRRRAMTQIRLLSVHLRRLFGAEFRRARFDAADFRAVLPITMPDQEDYGPKPRPEP